MNEIQVLAGVNGIHAECDCGWRTPSYRRSSDLPQLNAYWHEQDTGHRYPTSVEASVGGVTKQEEQ